MLLDQKKKDRKREDNDEKLKHRTREWRKSLPAPSSKNNLIDKSAVTATASSETPKERPLSYRKAMHSKEF